MPFHLKQFCILKTKLTKNKNDSPREQIPNICKQMYTKSQLQILSYLFLDIA